MKKRIITFILAICIVSNLVIFISPTVSAASSGTCGNNITWEIEGSWYSSQTLIISGTGAMPDWESCWDASWYPGTDTERKRIKTLIIKEGVTSIGDNSFAGLGITTAELPDSLTSIGAKAFSSTNLTGIEISENVTYIGNLAFSNCSNLSEFIVAKDNPSYLSLNGNLFNKSQTTLIQYALAQATETYEVPNTTKSISQSAFSKCSNLKNITIPDSVTFIGESAFRAAKKLENIVLTNNLTYINDYMFYDCVNLKNIVIPDKVTTIYQYAFKNCTKLVNVTFNDRLRTIKEHAFADCSGLKSVTIPDSVTHLGASAFYRCTSLENVKLPVNLSAMEQSTFYGCESLEEIVIPDGILSLDNNSICDYIFGYCTNLSKVILPPNLTEIGTYVFTGCTNLTSISLPEGLTEIGGLAFSYSGITDITIPKTVTAMYDSTYRSGTRDNYSAFEDCEFLQQCTFEYGMSTIPKYALKKSSVETIIIPNTVTSIEINAFYNCDNITDVYYGGSEDEWSKINISSGNTCLTNAKIHYNCTSASIDTEMLKSLNFEKWHAYFLTNTNSALNSISNTSSVSLPYTFWELAKNKEFLSRTLYNAYKDEAIFNIGTYLYGVIDGKDIAFGLSEYYDLILASIIKESYMTDFSLDDTKSSIGANFEKLVGNILFEIGGAVGEDMYTVDWTVADTSVVSKAFAEVFPTTKYDEIVDACKLSIKGGESLGEVIERGVVVGQLAQHNKATAEVLTDIINATDDGDLKSALSNVVSAYTDYSDPVNIVTSFMAKGFEIGLESAEQAFEIISDKVVSVILECIGIGVVSPTLSIGTAVSDLIFSTGEKCELYFTLKAINKIEDSIKNVMSSYGSADISTITDGQAAKIIEVNRLLHTNALFGLKASKRFVDITYGDKTLAFKIYRSDDTKAMYEDYAYIAESQVNGILTNYNEIISLSKECFEGLKTNDSVETDNVNNIIENCVERISLTSPQKLNYIAGESLDTTGMVITAYMTDGTTKTVTSGYLMFGFDSDVLGQQKITVEYENKIATFNITVCERPEDNEAYLEVTLNRQPLTYYQYESFNAEDISVKVHCSSGAVYTPDRVTLSNYSSEVIGKRTLTVKYYGMTADFEIEIIEPQLTELKLLEPDKKVYYVNDNIDLTGLGVIAVYNTGTHMLLNRGQYDCSHDVITNSGINTINISYGNVQADFDVIAYSNETVLGVLDGPQYSDGNAVTTDTIYNYDKIYTTVYNASNQKTNLYIIAAFYNINGLIDTSITKLDFNVESKTFELDIPDNMLNVTEIKLFYWDYNTIAPLANSIKI